MKFPKSFATVFNRGEKKPATIEEPQKQAGLRESPAPKRTVSGPHYKNGCKETASGRKSRESPSSITKTIVVTIFSLLILPYGPNQANSEQRFEGYLSDLDASQVQYVCTKSKKWMKKKAKKYKIDLPEDTENIPEVSVIKHAWSCGDFGAVRAMVTFGLQPDQALDGEEQTLLHLAAATGNTAMCHFLVSNGANNFRINFERKVPATLALENNNLDALRVMINACPQEELSKLFKILSVCDGFETACLSILRQSLDRGMVLGEKDLERILKVLMRLDSVDSRTDALALLLQKGLTIPSGRKFKDFKDHSGKFEFNKNFTFSSLTNAVKTTFSETTNTVKHWFATKQINGGVKKAISDEQFRTIARIVSNNIGNQWKCFLRELNVVGDTSAEESLINFIEARARGDLKEQAYQSMMEYHRRKGKAANASDIIHALKDCGRRDIVDKLRW